MGEKVQMAQYGNTVTTTTGRGEDKERRQTERSREKLWPPPTAGGHVVGLGDSLVSELTKAERGIQESLQSQ